MGSLVLGTPSPASIFYTTIEIAGAVTIVGMMDVGIPEGGSAEEQIPDSKIINIVHKKGDKMNTI